MDSKEVPARLRILREILRSKHHVTRNILSVEKELQSRLHNRIAHLTLIGQHIEPSTRRVKGYIWTLCRHFVVLLDRSDLRKPLNESLSRNDKGDALATQLNHLPDALR
jgi:hypothetical protein